MKKTMVFLLLSAVLSGMPQLKAQQWLTTGNSGTVPPGNFIGTTDNAGLAFRTFNQERMRIGNAGQVGIGTPNPNAKLHVKTTGAQDPLRIEITNAAGNAIPSFFVSSNGGTSIGSSTIAPVLPPVNGLYVNGNLEVAGGQVNIGSVENLEDAGDWAISSNSDFVPTRGCDLNLGSVDLPWYDIFLCNAPVVLSDMRVKQNVQNLSYGLNEILKLRSVTYNSVKGNDGKKKIGLIAQEVQQIIPEMVSNSKSLKDESTGKITKIPSAQLGLDYTALIPILVKAVQEQQATIAFKEEQLEKVQNQAAQLQSQLDQLKSTLIKKGVLSHNESSTGELNTVSLQQNKPNPFYQNTIIRYNIPTGSNGQILIADLTGRKVKSVAATESGQVQINANDLAAGTYIYTLMINGRPVTSKKMMLMK